ncbi:MAG: hypothetical protein ACYCWE_00070 [Eubacteriales bacterium]
MEYERFKELKNKITDDMRKFITYVPDKEADLLVMMRNYLNTEHEDRPLILSEITNCINGKEYNDPYADEVYYTFDTVDMVDTLLEKYYKSLCAADGDEMKISAAIENVIGEINKLNELSHRGLIDTMRRELICGLVETAAEDFGYGNAMDDVDDQRMW